LNNVLHLVSIFESNHINLNYVPLLNFFSKFLCASFKTSINDFSGFPYDNITTHKTPSYLRQISFADYSFISGTTSVIHALVADESELDPPPATKASDQTFKNSKI